MADVTHHQADFRIQARRIDVFDKGTRFRMGTDEQSDWVIVREGTILVRKGKLSRDVHAGEMLVAKGDSKPVVSKIKKEEENMHVNPILVSGVIAGIVILALVVWVMVFFVRMFVDVLRRDSLSAAAKVGLVFLFLFTGLIGAFIYYLIFKPIPGCLVMRCGGRRVIVWPNVLGILLAFLALVFCAALLRDSIHAQILTTPTPSRLAALYTVALLFTAGLVGRAFLIPVDRLRDLSAYYHTSAEETSTTRIRRWKTRLVFIGIVLVVVLVLRGVVLNAIFHTSLSKSGTLEIVRRPPPPSIFVKEVESIPFSDPKDSMNGWQVDLREADLRKADIKDRERDLLYADFDSTTKWPDDMSKVSSFKPDLVMKLGKNPGLGLSSLHKQGITGKGVGIAIIDQTLLVDHVEYKDRLKMYEEIHSFRIGRGGNFRAQMHGPATASIAVGKTVGVAPGADLYYIAEDHIGFDLLFFLKRNRMDFGSPLPIIVLDFRPLARSIDRILEINKTLPEGSKIRVISASVGWGPGQVGYREVVRAVERAKKAGVFVVSSSLQDTYKADGMAFQALGREPLLNPDNPASYSPGLFWQNDFFREGGYASAAARARTPNGWLMVPMDSRCIASQSGVDNYVFYRSGGWSWSIPYIAGLYALACQVKPDITPQEFWTTAMATGDSVTINRNGKQYILEKIVNPARLIGALQGSHR